MGAGRPGRRQRQHRPVRPAGPTLPPTSTPRFVDVERCVAALATATSTLEARRLACLEASPIIDQERADLIAEETR